MMDRLVERIMRKAEENKGVKGRVMAPPGGVLLINAFVGKLWKKGRVV